MQFFQWSPCKTALNARPHRNDAEIDVTVVIVNVLLAPQDMPGLRRLAVNRTRQHPDSVARPCRAWIAGFASGASEHVLADKWPKWREYIARHERAEDIVGRGVVSFTAEDNGGTCVDLILRRSDGCEVRLRSDMGTTTWFPNMS